MITYIKGRLIEKSPTKIIVEANGIGYYINISLNTFEKIGDDENITIYTHLQRKEDADILFGFKTKSERKLFQQLISVCHLFHSIQIHYHLLFLLYLSLVGYCQ